MNQTPGEGDPTHNVDLCHDSGAMSIEGDVFNPNVAPRL